MSGILSVVPLSARHESLDQRCPSGSHENRHLPVLENSKDCFSLAVTSANIHPTRGTGFSEGGFNFIINRRHTFCAERIYIS